MIYKIFLIIKGSPFLYKAFLFFRGRYQEGFFPDQSFDIHLAGYQRSGNTYAQRLLLSLVPDLKIASHVHSIATIKLAFRYKVPVICLIRDPQEAVSSSYIKNIDNGKNKFTAMAALYEYVSYYEFVLKNLDNIAICKFSELRNDPKHFLNLVTLQLGISFKDDDILTAENSTIKSLRENRSEGKVLSEASSNLPNSRKNSLKRNAIEHLKLDPLYSRAVELFELLENT